MFQPPHCPYAECTGFRPSPSYHCRRRGSYRRRCDGRSVQRYQCLECGRSFSQQTFRVDYRLRRNELNTRVFLALASKTTLRQTARVLGCTRTTVERRLVRFGGHARRFHHQRLRRLAESGGLPGGTFVLDELETFETSRRLRPLTVPVVAEAESFFVVGLAVAPLAARKPRPGAETRRQAEIVAAEGRRRSGSTRAVRAALSSLETVLRGKARPNLVTDLKTTYPGCIRRELKREVEHVAVSSRAQRDTRNPLFPINFTFAMMRDGIARLVRRTWAASKKAARLECHLWLWVGWRNYVRMWKNNTAKTRASSAARELGVATRRLSTAEFLRWRVFERQAAA